MTERLFAFLHRIGLVQEKALKGICAWLYLLPDALKTPVSI